MPEEKGEEETAEPFQQSVRNLQESFQKQLMQVQDRMTQDFDKKLQEQRDEFRGYLERRRRKLQSSSNSRTK